TYHTGQQRGSKDPGETTYEVTPLMVDNTLYLCTPFSTVIALDPVTGEEKWRFDPQLKQPPTPTTQHMTCRGVSYHVASPGDLPATPPATAGPLGPAISGGPVDAERLVAASVDEITTQAAGVPQNIVTGTAKQGATNPAVNREPPPASVTL